MFNNQEVSKYSLFCTFLFYYLGLYNLTDFVILKVLTKNVLVLYHSSK